MAQNSRSAYALIILASTFVATGLHGQSIGIISGTVVDQASKNILGASVTAKNETGVASKPAVTDTTGHFSIANLAPGNYTVETTDAGFARSTRLGVPVTAGGTQELSITLFVDAVSQSVTVQESVSLAVEQAPMGNSLDATAAHTEISSTVMTNFMA